ncbi:DMT family transporter [Halobacillus naozhouensis]|uniref:Multidrug efflux SMR transporter n=1 Tax=Halobacillus naozhouensis TaxID=554880 RepID=A0ABY8J4A5_9BACI|nr:multidrug efflux SMR transporter [Halobacillus naozhouensis]WFT76452.1 multidrug efflux SMR transporter [Halobacillus naozhouensis]
MLRYYILLSFSIILEVFGASFMKKSEGFTHLGATLIVIVSYSIALALYILLTKQHELGIVNALWAGGGTILVSVIGIALFQESISLIKIVGIVCIVLGVIGLNLPNQQNELRKAES